MAIHGRQFHRPQTAQRRQHFRFGPLWMVAVSIPHSYSPQRRVKPESADLRMVIVTDNLPRGPRRIGDLPGARTLDAFAPGLDDGREGRTANARPGHQAIRVKRREPQDRHRIVRCEQCTAGGTSRRARPGDRPSPVPRASHGWPHTQPGACRIGRCPAARWLSSADPSARSAPKRSVHAGVDFDGELDQVISQLAQAYQERDAERERALADSRAQLA